MRRRRRNKQRKIIIISICFLLLMMSVGYAAMSTNLEINAKGNVLKKTTGAKAILENVSIVTSGDGLYKDSFEEDVYTYKGKTPNNYVNFNNELWRIISVNTSDNTIKIIKADLFTSMVYDNIGNRVSADYCNYASDYGCNIWGSIYTLFDINFVPLKELEHVIGSTKYSLPEKEASLNVYLNNEYYNSLSSESKNMIVSSNYKAGLLRNGGALQPMTEDIKHASSAIWKGKIALIDATEYARASDNTNCTGVSAYYVDAKCYITDNDNWLNIGSSFFTMSPYSYGMSFWLWCTDVFSISSTSDKTLGPGCNTSSSAGVRPVVTLSSEVQIISGDGTQNNAYSLKL